MLENLRFYDRAHPQENQENLFRAKRSLLISLMAPLPYYMRFEACVELRSLLEDFGVTPEDLGWEPMPSHQPEEEQQNAEQQEEDQEEGKQEALPLVPSSLPAPENAQPGVAGGIPNADQAASSSVNNANIPLEISAQAAVANLLANPAPLGISCTEDYFLKRGHSSYVSIFLTRYADRLHSIRVRLSYCVSFSSSILLLRMLQWLLYSLRLSSVWNFCSGSTYPSWPGMLLKFTDSYQQKIIDFVKM